MQAAGNDTDILPDGTIEIGPGKVADGVHDRRALHIVGAAQQLRKDRTTNGNLPLFDQYLEAIPLDPAAAAEVGNPDRGVRKDHQTRRSIARISFETSSMSSLPGIFNSR